MTTRSDPPSSPFPKAQKRTYARPRRVDDPERGAAPGTSYVTRIRRVSPRKIRANVRRYVANDSIVDVRAIRTVPRSAVARRFRAVASTRIWVSVT
jgi:mRNA-degrading endonuclease toxin of MazEF toxin-antitoxin module